LKAAKATLASLIQRQRPEERERDALKNRIKDMMGRAQSALDNGRDDLATEAASAVAQMENELTIRHETCDRLD
jgi:phage shock protein A